VVVAIAALDIVGVGFGLFTSPIGVLYAAIAAFWIGAGIASLMEPTHAGRNAAIVAISITGCVVLFLASVWFRPVPPGTSTGGPNILSPPGQQNTLK
jgi:hypothetical protein